MKAVNYSFSLIVMVLLTVGVSTAIVSHDPSEILPGVFSIGDFTFNGNLLVQNSTEVFLGLSNTEASGRQWDLVSAGSAGGIGVGKFSIYDKTAGQSRMVIGTGGRVGIGTTAPDSLLHISSSSNVNMRLQTTGVDQSATFRFQNDARTWLFQLAGYNNDNFMIYDETAPAARLLIDTAGNVGIGTTAPTAKLHIGGTAGADGIRFPDGTLQTTASPVSSPIPSGAVMFFLSSCPSGWSEFTSNRGRYIVGLPSGGALGATVGTALSNRENRAVGRHNHGVNDPGHRHRLGGPSGSGGNPGTAPRGSPDYPQDVSSSTTGISIQNAGSVSGTNAPYIQLLVCRKD